MALDSCGNLLVGKNVAGNSCDPEGCDYLALKYDSSGDVLWDRRVADANATAMTLDERGNLYVTGYSRRAPSSSLTIKYDPEGQTLWETRTEDIYPSALAADSEENVYVAGSGDDRLLVKYDSDGAELWSVLSASDYFIAMEVDPAGYVYLARSCGQRNCIELREHDGNEIWRAVYGGAQRRSRILALALDSRGNVYATGFTERCNNPSCRLTVLTVKYDQDGEEVWVRELPDPDLRPAEAALRVDADESLYLSLGSCGDPCALITAKYRSDGAEAWVSRRHGVEIVSNDDYYYYAPSSGRIEIDADGDVYVHGIAVSTVKYDSDGTERLVVELPGVVGTSVALGREKIHFTGCLDDDYVVLKDSDEGFHLEPDFGETPLEVTVRAPDLTVPPGADATTYEWSFGDGATATGRSATHTYSGPGSFELELVSSAGPLQTTKLRPVHLVCPLGDVSPWVSVDIGNTEFTGNARIEAAANPTLHICAGGRRLGDAGEDSFHFVYQEMIGDLVLTARISELTGSHRSRSGVMLRQSLEADAPDASIVFDQSNRGWFRFRFRNETGRRHRGSRGDDAATPDAWVRIQRQGDDFIGLSSVDGITWTEVDRVTMDLPEKLFAGFATSARAGSARFVEPVSVSFDSFELGLDPPPLGRSFLRGDVDAGGFVNLTDCIMLLRALFGGEAEAVTCEKSGDADDNGALEISDAVYLLGHLFRAGPRPAPPFGRCDVDPTADSLTCEAYAGCE